MAMSTDLSRDLRLKPFINGGLASLTAELSTFPIDTAKTRLQIQGQVSDEACREIRYRGLIHALYRIFREEGIRALYHGLPAGLLRQASYGTMKIGLYHYFKTLYARGKGETLYMNIVSGFSSGAIAAAIANPTDVLKVRMQAATSLEYRQKQNVFFAFLKLYQSEGFKGLYRGVGPTSQRAGVVAGALLPSYDFFKKTLLQSGLGFESKDTVTHFTASFLAGLLGTLAANPIDVIKSRMMNQNTSRVLLGQFYHNSFDCCIKTIKTEGIMALYKGFTPSYLRLGPWNIIFFMTYEQLQKFSFT